LDPCRSAHEWPLSGDVWNRENDGEESPTFDQGFLSRKGYPVVPILESTVMYSDALPGQRVKLNLSTVESERLAFTSE
jgi:hypothetical protein